MPSDCNFGASPAFGATTIDSCLCLASFLPLPALFRPSYLFPTLPCAVLRNPSGSLPLSGNLARHHGCCPRLRPSSPPLPHLNRHNPHHYTQPSRRHTRSGRKCTSLQTPVSAQLTQEQIMVPLGAASRRGPIQGHPDDQKGGESGKGRKSRGVQAQYGPGISSSSSPSPIPERSVSLVILTRETEHSGGSLPNQS